MVHNEVWIEKSLNSYHVLCYVKFSVLFPLFWKVFISFALGVSWHTSFLKPLLSNLDFFFLLNTQLMWVGRKQSICLKGLTTEKVSLWLMALIHYEQHSDRGAEQVQVGWICGWVFAGNMGLERHRGAGQSWEFAREQLVGPMLNTGLGQMETWKQNRADQDKNHPYNGVESWYG